jgi:hypothetical protein
VKDQSDSRPDSRGVNITTTSVKSQGVKFRAGLLND